ncbi:MAG: hypothetical protein ACR2IE_07850 [Candidatus Sumerlaeaceae bacterium]
MATAVLCVAVVLGSRALFKAPRRSDQGAAASAVAVEPDVDAPRYRSARQNNAAMAHRAALSRATETTRPRTMPRLLSGFVVDDFRNWTSIPDDYHADRLQVVNGAITLRDTETTGSRFGTLLSPPLELWQPALAAPAQNTTTVPEGCEVRTEISLSRDGKSWSGWQSLERYQAPDGKQVQPPSAPTWSGTRPSPISPPVTDSTETSGPFVRYRLTLTSSSPASPFVQDVRIWRNARF